MSRFAILVFGPGHPAINYLLLLAIADDALGMAIIAIAIPIPSIRCSPSTYASCWLVALQPSSCAMPLEHFPHIDSYIYIYVDGKRARRRESRTPLSAAHGRRGLVSIKRLRGNSPSPRGFKTCSRMNTPPGSARVQSSARAISLLVPFGPFGFQDEPLAQAL